MMSSSIVVELDVYLLELDIWSAIADCVSCTDELSSNAILLGMLWSSM